MDCSPEQVKQLYKRSKKEELENKFLGYWVALFPDLPLPVRQHKFHPSRKWRWDFAWPEWKLAVEIQGGSWVVGGHNTALGQANDYEKHNEAVRLGWRTLFFNTPMLKDMAAAVELAAEVLCEAKEVEDGDL